MSKHIYKSIAGEINSSFLIAGSIVVAGLIIAGAVVYSGSSSDSPSQLGQVEDVLNDSEAPSFSIREINETDHILGDPNAPVKIIEFSDLECPFCKVFHVTIASELKKDYIDSGKVAWIFRHNPIPSHSKAVTEAVATECVAELKDDNAFWSFIDRIYEITPSNNGFDLNQLPILAAEFGINTEEFSECLNSGRYDNLISSHMNEALQAGAKGTPYAVVFNDQEEYFIIPGALAAEDIKSIFDRALGKI